MLTITIAEQRIHYFDWLRGLAVLGVVIYHALQPFASANWFIVNDRVDPVLALVVNVLAIVGMPVLFLIAGASAWFALQKRSIREFLGERAQRLLLPFAVGTLVLGSINGYILGVFNRTAPASFLEYAIAYPGIIFDYNVHHVGLSFRLLLVGVHLWFLGALFVFCLAGAPIFAFLSSTRGRSMLAALARLSDRPGATLLFAVPATLPIVALFASVEQPQLWDNWSFGFFSVVFLSGYVMYSDPRLASAARRDSVPAIVIALLGTGLLVVANYAEWAMARQQYGLTYFSMLSLYGLTAWAWTLALLGLGMRARFMQLPLPNRLGELAMPLYILHYSFVSAISVFVIRSPLELPTKIAVNVVLGVGISLLGAIVATNVPFLRPLMGLRRTRSRFARTLPSASPVGARI